jgi:hypothetical protein
LKQLRSNQLRLRLKKQRLPKSKLQNLNQSNWKISVMMITSIVNVLPVIWTS